MNLVACSRLLVLLSILSPLYAQDIAVVPQVKRLTIQDKATFNLKDGYSISAPEAFIPAAELLIQDIDTLYGIKGSINKEQSRIILKPCKGMKKETYDLSITPDQVIVKARDYPSLMLAITSLLQIMNKQDGVVAPCCHILDSPSFDYRTYMLDVARSKVDVETVKHIIDLCRWYKIRYMQFHLTDDQLFTFESKHYPQLTEGKFHYTQEQMKDLVNYATQRGIIIIPEFDIPGHSTALRKAMPEIFGEPNYGMIDIIKPECQTAVKTIIKEMIDIFHTSPYVHIGADEVATSYYGQQKHVKEYLAAHPDKADDVHDLYLQFIVDMHQFVQSCGKQTMAWECFQGDGSDKVKIPKDLCIHVFGTVKALPQDLIDHGFTIVNSTFKPWYTTPVVCWSPKSIYEANARHWENHHDKAPSYHTPFQLPSNEGIKGVQMCSWALANYDQLLTAHQRIAAFSESAWNDDMKEPYCDYLPRAEQADKKILDLLFPATEQRDGFKAEDPYVLNHHQVNTFGNEAHVFFKATKAEDTIRYTKDGTTPTLESDLLTAPITLTKNTHVKYVMFDKKGQPKAYKSVMYFLNALDVRYSGDLLPVRDRYFRGLKTKENFCDNITVTLTTAMPDTKIYYTIDGSKPSLKSKLYSSPLTFKEKTDFRAEVLNNKGRSFGAARCQFIKKDRLAPID